MSRLIRWATNQKPPKKLERKRKESRKESSKPEKTLSMVSLPPPLPHHVATMSKPQVAKKRIKLEMPPSSLAIAVTKKVIMPKIVLR